MENEKPMPLFNLGLCCITPGAFAGLTERRIPPSVFFDAHRYQQFSNELNVIHVRANFVNCSVPGPITSFFDVGVSILGHFVLELCVETSTNRKTTILKLKSETI